MSTARVTSFAIAVVVAAAAACAGSAPAPAHPAPDLARTRAAIEAAAQGYAQSTRGKDPAAVAAFFTSDGELLEPGMDALRGRAAIEAFLAPLVPKFDVESSALTTDAIDVLADDAAIQWGHFAQRAGPHGGAMADYHGRFVAEWRREPDGAWRLAHLLMQPSP